MTLNSDQLDHFRKLLNTERERVNEALQLRRDSSAVGVSDETEENGLETHLGDQGTNTFMREMDVSLEDHEEHVLKELDHAISRLEEGTYGTCEGCGTDISPDRLEALVYATRCVSCSEKAAAEA